MSNKHCNMNNFCNDFLWGVSTSSYQIEGKYGTAHSTYFVHIQTNFSKVVLRIEVKATGMTFVTKAGLMTKAMEV